MTAALSSHRLSSDALMQAAIGLQQQGNYEQALAAYHQAIATDPSNPKAYYNRATLYYATGKKDLMNADLQQVLALDFNNAVMMRNIGLLLHQEARYVDCIKVVSRAIELAPDDADAWLLLADAHYLLGNSDTAGRMYEHLTQKFPDNALIHLADALFTPPILASKAEIVENRARIKRKMAEFLKRGWTVDNAIGAMRASLFYMAYHGMSHKELIADIAQFFLKICPSLTYTAAHCKQPRKAPGEKLRIGFVSPSMHQVTLNQFFLSMIERLQKDPQFEVSIISTTSAGHAGVSDIRHRIQHYIEIPMDLPRAQQIIAEAKMDVLVYLEVGIAPLMYCLPFARLAPVQAVLGGMPVTTGIPNMDYFLSSHDIEVEGAQENYTEKLILRERVLSVFTPPKITPPFKTREQLGLPTGDYHLYACPVQLFKIHPDMDAVFAQILARDPKALILLFDAKMTVWAAQLQKRFLTRMKPELAQRILFLPFFSRDDFLHMLKAVDTVMDSFHFSFGTTANLAVAAGVPFVTWPGPYFSGRASWRIFNQIGVPELIAPTHEAYVEIALKLANDKIFYQRMADKLQTDGHVIFDNYELVDDFAVCFKELYASVR